MDNLTVADQISIKDVQWHPLNTFKDERGAVLRILRDDDSYYSTIREIYCSEINSGAVKAWKRHLRMTQRISVPVGRIVVAIFDSRVDSPWVGKLVRFTIERIDNYGLLIVPPGLWYGFKNIGAGPALIVNCTDQLHDPLESEVRSSTDANFPLQWSDI